MSTGSEALFGIFPALAPITYLPTAPRPPKREYVSTGTREGGTRKHRPAAIGDTFGPWRVIGILPRDATSNERVRVVCAAWHTRDVYAFNLRVEERPCRACMRVAIARRERS